MASMIQLLIFPLIFHTIFSIPVEPSSPNSQLLLDLYKCPFTHQYLTQISFGSPFSTPLNLALDLCAPSLLLDCASTSLDPSISTQNILHSFSPENQFKNCDHIHSKTEGLIPVEFADLGWYNFLFSCAKTSSFQGLGRGVKGVLGLGNSRTALPLQLTTNLGFSRKFALCLSSPDGAIILGEHRYDHISRTLQSTPFTYREGNGIEKSSGYYINVRSIAINGVKISLNKTLLQMNEAGFERTKISTRVPYTTMETTVYETFTKAFVKAAEIMGLKRVENLEPFEVCFSSRGIEKSRFGPLVPVIELMLQSQMVRWRIKGRNSMVHVNDEVMCLGFLNGGVNSEAGIVIGGYQLEDKFLEFNLETSRLRFSMNPLSCSSFGIQPFASAF